MKICKTFYEAQTVSRLKKIIQSSPIYHLADKILLHLWKKKLLTEILRTEIYRHLLSKCFKNAVVKKLCMANVFADTKQKHLDNL